MNMLQSFNVTTKDRKGYRVMRRLMSATQSSHGGIMSRRESQFAASKQNEGETRRVPWQVEARDIYVVVVVVVVVVIGHVDPKFQY